MDKKILSKIKKAKILTPEELTELEASFSTTSEEKSPKDKVNEPVEEVKDTPKDIAPKTEDVTPMEEPVMEEPKDVAPPVEPMGTPGTPEAPVKTDAPVTPEAPMDIPSDVPPVDPSQTLDPSQTPVAETGTDTGQVSYGDLEQVKTTMSALENKIRSLEELISKLSVVGEPTQEDFGISGKGKTVAGGEPAEDKIGAMIKKMGGYSK